MPLVDEGANFIVYSEGGCFTWTSTRPEVIGVTPTSSADQCGSSVETFQAASSSNEAGCTSAAIVTLAPRWGGTATLAKTQAIVTAEDAQSAGHILRCDINVDRIHSLQIVTKTHELFLEEAPEEFSVRAYDDQGNEFSTLEGIVFKWTVESSSSSGSENVQFIKFRDSTYALEPKLAELEAKGMQGSKVLLEGIKTGSSKVSVRLVSKAYGDVPPAEVTVMVVANLFLVPHNAYVMLGAAVDYHAEQMKSNRIHKIELSKSQQYYLDVANTDLAAVDSNEKQTVFAYYQVGVTDVSLRDHNVGRDEGVKSPSADLHIVQPAYITIDIDPYSNWNVLVGNPYNLHISIFDAENHRLFPSSNMIAKITVDAGYFEMEETTKNGTWVNGRPLKTGTAEVRAVLKGTINPANGEYVLLDTPLRASAQMEVFEPIALEPQLSVFPWDPINKSTHQVKYTVLGVSTASSPFVWSSVNTSVATVTQNGVSKTSGRLGETAIIAAMNRASHNRGQAVIMVVPVVGLEIVRDHTLEVEVGSRLNIPVSFMAANKRRFTSCSQLPYTQSLEDRAIFDVSREGDPKELHQDACTHVALEGKNVGFSKLTVSYSYPSHQGNSVFELNDDVTVAAYDPLKPAQPDSGTAILAVDSSLHVVWSGGPQPWIHRSDSHYHVLTVKDEGLLDISKRLMTPSGLFGFNVFCTKLGETELTLKVGNKKSVSLPKPVGAQSTVKVVCAEPDRIQLEADVRQPEDLGIPCPLMARTGRVAALCYEDLSVDVTVYDSARRKFDNISTLDINWEVSNTNLATLRNKKGVLVPDNTFLGGYKQADLAKTYQILNTKGQPGYVDVTATLKKSSSYLMGGFGSISDTLELNLVHDAEIVPSKVVVFNHPDNRERLTVQHGSGYFDVISSEFGVAEHNYTASNKSIRIVPLIEGETVVHARDLCLAPSTKHTSATAHVQVIGVHKVQLVVVDKVQQGRAVTAQVKLWDQTGELITPQMNHMQVLLTPAAQDVVTIEPKTDTRPKDLLFTVKGAVLGETVLTATALFGRKRVASTPMPIQVFPPLELEPRNITLIIGAKFQVQVLGGPRQPDAAIEFSLGNTKTAETNNIGLVSALSLGSTRLTGRAVGTDGTTGRKVVFSEDHVDVHVVKLEGIRIKAPLARMRVGAEMPLAAVGLDTGNQNAYSFGSALPDVQLMWSANNHDAADLKSVFWRNGVAASSYNNGAMRLVAKKPGRVVIKLRAVITSPLEAAGQYQLDRNLEFKDQIEVRIFDDLAARAPHVPRNTLLMATYSEYDLKTNRDASPGATVTYFVLGEKPEVASGIITVSSEGVVKSYRNLGTAVILIRVTEDFSVVQEMSVTVNVKPVTYMMLNALPVFQPATEPKANNNNNGLVNFLPRGLSLAMEVSFHDETGLRFDAVDLVQQKMTHRPSRFDTNLVKAEKDANHSLHADLLLDGYTVLRSSVLANYEGGSRTVLDDFVVLDVQKAIAPVVEKLTVGDVIGLHSAVTSLAEHDEGQWLAEPKGMMSIDEETGMATVLHSGLARVSYFLDDHRRRTSVDIEVQRANRIVFHARDGQQHLTNSAALQSVPFSILPQGVEVNEDHLQKYNLHLVNEDLVANVSYTHSDLVARQLFTCRARLVNSEHDLASLMAVSAGFHDGNYACLFRTLDRDSTMIEGDVEVAVLPTSPLSPARHEKTTVKFSSSFRPVASSGLTLTNVEPSADLIVSGLDRVLDGVLVTPSDSHYLRVGRSYKNDGENRVWPVSVKSAYWSEAKPGTDLHVSMTCSVTGQHVDVPVDVQFRGDQCANIELGWSSLIYFFIGHYQSLLFIVASCIICVFVTRLILVQGASAKAAALQQQKSSSDSSKTLGSPINRVQTNGTPNSFVNASGQHYLWTVDNSPVYGSPTPYARRSSPRSLTQYSYTEQ